MTFIFYDIYILKIIEQLLIIRCKACSWAAKINKIWSSASNSWFRLILPMTITLIFIKCPGKQMSLDFHYLVTVMFPVLKVRFQQWIVLKRHKLEHKSLYWEKLSDLRSHTSLRKWLLGDRKVSDFPDDWEQLVQMTSSQCFKVREIRLQCLDPHSRYEI